MKTLTNERLEKLKGMAAVSQLPALGIPPAELQEMVSRLLAAEAQLAELRGQAPVARVSEESFSSDGTSDILTINLPIGMELFSRPVPPAASQPVAWQWFYLKQWHVTNDPERARDVAEGGVEVQPLGVCSASHPSYRDGIEAAAKWLDKQRESFDSEHGRHDPDTGTFEFGNDAQLEYSSTLAELSEGIRALQPTASQPYTVTEESLLRRFDAAVEAELRRVSHLQYDIHEICDHFAKQVRAAMLQSVDSPIWSGIDWAKGRGTLTPIYQDGWTLVPQKANIAMIRAGGKAAREYMEKCGGNSPQAIYQAMIAAAPQHKGE